VSAKLLNHSFSVHSGAASFLKSFTVSSSTYRKLIVGFANDSLSIRIANVRWGGASGTKLHRVVLADVPSGTRPTVEFWELIAPSPGTQNIYWESGSSGSSAHHVVAMEIVSTDVREIVDFAFNSREPEVRESSLSLKVQIGALVIDLVSFSNSSVIATATGDLAELWQNRLSGNHVAGSAIGLSQENGEITARWSLDRPSQVAHAAIVLKPAVAGYGNETDGYVGLTIPTFNVASGTNLGIEALEFGSGSAVLAMGNVSLVPDFHFAAGILFVQDGHLKFKGGLGTITTVASA
jgi:hypothetical protein